MSQAPQFVISEFTNPSGEIVFRLTGWLDGKRIRKNFSTRAEAGAERQSMEIQQCQAETGIRATATRLSEEQLHEAEAAFQRLADAPKSLSFYLEFALATYRAPDREHPLAEAVATYIVSKEREHAQNLLSISQLDHIRRHLKVLVAAFPRCLVSQLGDAAEFGPLSDGSNRRLLAGGEYPAEAESDNVGKLRVEAGSGSVGWVTAYLEQWLPAGLKIKDSRAALSWRRSEFVDVQGTVDDLPIEFVRVKREADVSAIKTALKDGQSLSFARLGERQNLQIK